MAMKGDKIVIDLKMVKNPSDSDKEHVTFK